MFIQWVIAAVDHKIISNKLICIKLSFIVTWIWTHFITFKVVLRFYFFLGWKSVKCIYSFIRNSKSCNTFSMFQFLVLIGANFLCLFSGSFTASTSFFWLNQSKDIFLWIEIQVFRNGILSMNIVSTFSLMSIFFLRNSFILLIWIKL